MEPTRTPGWYAVTGGVVLALVFAALGILDALQIVTIFSLQVGLGLAVISLLVAALLYIFYMRGTAVSKTGFGTLIGILLIGLVIPFMTINQQQAQATQASTQYDLTLHHGAALFGQYCAPCHGYQGQGIIGPQLNGEGGGGFPPPSKLTDEELTRTISGGVPNPDAINTYMMPAWLNTYGGPLTQDDISYLVALIRSSEPSYLASHPDLPKKNGFDYVYSSLTAQQQQTATAQKSTGNKPDASTFVDMTGQNAVAITALDQPGSNGSKWFWTVQGTKQANIIISAGTKVTWDNGSAIPHNVYSGYGTFNANPAPNGFKSDILTKGGAAFTFTFDKPGEYQFYCAIHPYMVGWITVK